MSVIIDVAHPWQASKQAKRLQKLRVKINRNSVCSDLLICLEEEEEKLCYNSNSSAAMEDAGLRGESPNDSFLNQDVSHFPFGEWIRAEKYHLKYFKKPPLYPKSGRYSQGESSQIRSVNVMNLAGNVMHVPEKYPTLITVSLGGNTANIPPVNIEWPDKVVCIPNPQTNSFHIMHPKPSGEGLTWKGPISPVPGSHVAFNGNVGVLNKTTKSKGTWGSMCSGSHNSDLPSVPLVLEEPLPLSVSDYEVDVEGLVLAIPAQFENLEDLSLAVVERDHSLVSNENEKKKKGKGKQGTSRKNTTKKANEAIESVADNSPSSSVMRKRRGGITINPIKQKAKHG